MYSRLFLDFIFFINNWNSIIYKQTPRYITNTSDSLKSFKIENIKAGKYFIVGLEDKSSNYRFDPKSEKIGFIKNYITIPNDSLLEIKLFKEVSKVKFFKPTQSSDCSAIVGFEGDIKNSKLTLKRGQEVIPSSITKIPKKDSLQIWFKPFKIEKSAIDSLHLTCETIDYTKDFTFKIKAQKHDSLSISAISSKTLAVNEDFMLRTNLPLSKIDETKLRLIKKDSTSVPFKLENDELNLTLKLIFQKEPLEKYTLTVPSDAIFDFIGQTTSKTLNFDCETKSSSDYGNLRLNLENVKQFPLIIELTDKNGIVKYTYYSEDSTSIDFNLIEPDLYTLRLIYDDNKNKIWDSGNYLNKKQPERVVYFPTDIDVRANWDVQQTFILKE